MGTSTRLIISQVEKRPVDILKGLRKKVVQRPASSYVQCLVAQSTQLLKPYSNDPQNPYPE